MDQSVNVNFVDGHVQTMKLDTLWSLQWSKAFQAKGPETRTDGSPIYK